MRLLFLGDIVGKPGVSAVCRNIPELRAELKLDVVIANAENAADGSGLTKRQFKQLTEDSTVDVITMGDHVYRKSELFETLTKDHRIVRPANFPAKAPGRGWTVVNVATHGSIAVINLLGRVFMRPVDCPFAAVDQALASIPENVRVRIVDMHAEATSDKQLMGHHLDGRVTAVFGTHTHVPTADAKITAKGMAYITDVGMTGPYESIIGRAVSPVLDTTIRFTPSHYHVATEDVRLAGVIIDIDPQTGLAKRIERFERKV